MNIDFFSAKILVGTSMIEKKAMLYLIKWLNRKLKNTLFEN